MAARGANPFYYQNDAGLGSALGATLGRALFGDPEAAAQLALRKAQMENYAAQAGEATSHAGLYDTQAEDQRVRTGYRKQFGPLGQSFVDIAGGGQPATAAPAAPPAVQSSIAPLVAGNIDIHNRPVVHNPDGSISTVRSISIGTDKGEVLIPTVVGGRVVSNDEAIRHFKQTGENLGTFRTPDDATAYANSLHEEQAQEYAQPPAPADTSARLARAMIPMIMAAGGTQENPNIGDMVGGVTALLGNDELARRGMVAQGKTPDKDFALTAKRADDIAQQGYDARYNTDTQVARINHESDIPVARIQSSDRRYTTDVESGDRRRGQDIESGDRQRGQDLTFDGKSLGKTVGFSLVSNVLPGARMTGGERSPEHNAEVGGAAHSYHLAGDGVEAFDVAPGTGARTFADAKAALQAQYGARLVEAIDETHRPGHGPHWHFAIQDPPAAPKAQTAKAPARVSAASNKMIEAELDKQLSGVGLAAQGTARSNMLASALHNYQTTGNPADAVRQVIDRYKLNAAARGGGKQQTAQADAAPVTGARKAPDGHWYVKQGNGYARVDVTG